jgi:hypothetical protein
MNVLLRKSSQIEPDNQGVYRNNFGDVVTSVEREKMGDSNGPKRLGKMLWEGVKKRRDKKLLQNWAGSHARRPG